MKVVFVGAGRLATHFAQALRASGHNIVAVYSRTLSSAKALSSVVGGFATDSLSSFPTEADAFVIAVKDSALAEVLDLLGQGREGQLFLHTAGSIALSVFGQHTPCGVIYPMQTFSKERKVDFSRIPIFIEGDGDHALRVARQLATSVSSHVSELSSADRRHLHLAAVFACNFVNHCYTLSAEILERHGMTFDVMLPLIAETAEKVASVHPRDAQTGPAVRYDENVLNAQRQLLADQPTVQAVYDLMSKSIHQTSNFLDEPSGTAERKLQISNFKRDCHD